MGDGGLLGLLRGVAIPHHLHVAVADGVVVVHLEGVRSPLLGQVLTDFAHQQGRGVGAEEDVLPTNLVELAEERLLFLQNLGDILDDHVGILTGVLQGGDVGNPLPGPVRLLLGQPALLHVELQKTADAHAALFPGGFIPAKCGYFLSVDCIPKGNHTSLGAHSDHCNF